MRADREDGSIILNGSCVWQMGFPIYATYGGTKAALKSFVRTWTAEFAGKGIRTNMVARLKNFRRVQRGSVTFQF